MALTKILTEGIKDGEILNVDIDANASIARTKLANVDLVDDTSPQLGGNLDVNTKNIVFGDSSDGSSDDVLSFGAGSDLRLYHDGSNSYIKQVSSGTGNLLIFADGHEIQLIPKSGEPGIKVVNDGTVELYYNGTKKFETTSSGVDIAGNCTITGNFRGNDNVKLNLGNGDDLQIYHDGTYNRLAANGQIFLQNKAANETYLAGYENGTVELYYDNSKKFETTSTGATLTGNLGIGTTSPNNAIHLKGTDPVIEMEDTAGGDRQGIFVSDGGYLGFYNFTDGRVDMAIDGTGKVGIGTTSPVGKLTVNSGNITLSDGYGFTNGADADKTFMAGTSGSSGHLAFGVNNTERIRINSAGQILSGMTSANVGDANAIFAGGGNAGSGNYGKIYLSANYTNPAADIALSFIGTSTNNVSNNAMAFIGVHADGQHASNNYPTRFGFFTNTGTSSATEKVRIHNSGEVTIPAGITLGTAVTSKASSNTLNDYERGLWTPTITGGGTSISYGNRRAWYVKIGEFVHASFYITFSAQGDGNQFVMGGLPFTSNYDSPISYNSGGNLSYKDCAFTNNAEQRLYVGNNGANIYFYHNASDPHSPAGSIITTTSVITSSLYGFVAYQTDS